MSLILAHPHFGPKKPISIRELRRPKVYYYKPNMYYGQNHIPLRLIPVIPVGDSELFEDPRRNGPAISKEYYGPIPRGFPSHLN
ncbi:hypothetical protein AHAS_Ahas13G0446800 [Arachis hypogaea]